MSFHGFSIELSSLGSRFWGVSIELSYALVVNVKDDSGSLIPNSVVQVYDDNNNLISQLSADNGIAYIALPSSGTYNISVLRSDVKKEIVFDGENTLNEDFIVKGEERKFRIKPLFGNSQKSNWSNELIVKL